MSLRHAVHGLLRDRLRPFAAACFLIAVLLFAAMDTFGRATELEEHGILSGHFSDRLSPQLLTEARLEGEGLPDALRRNELPDTIRSQEHEPKKVFCNIWMLHSNF